MIDLNNPDVIDLLQRISAQLEALPGRIAAVTQSAKPLAAADRAKLEVLLPGISEAVGSAQFTVRELLAEADGDPRLQAAIESAAGDLSPKSLGKLLRRAAGHAHDDRQVQMLPKVRDGVLWRVVQLSKSN